MVKNNPLTTGIALSLLILLVIASVIPSTMSRSINLGGTTWYVGGGGPGNFTRIQDAIDDASDGDTVFVYEGVYTENVIIDKEITLTGEDKENTIIDGDFKGHVVEVKSNRVIVTGFTIQNSKTSHYQKHWSGVYISDFDHCIICNNRFLNDNNGIGIRLYSKEIQIFGNSIIKPVCFGILLDGLSEDNTIHNNTITSSGKSGIQIGQLDYGSNGNNISCNYITNNSEYGIGIIESNDNIIIGNTLVGNEVGIKLEDYSEENKLIGNNVEDNKFGISLEDFADNNIVNKNHVEDNINGIHVDRSFGNHLYLNYLNNHDNSYDTGINTWNTTYILGGGNTWIGYEIKDEYSGPDQDIPGFDEIGDLPYEIPGGINKDWYPWIDPFMDVTPPNVSIIKPHSSLYFNNKEILPFFEPVIVGPIEIEVQALDDQSGIGWVELYIDGELKANVTSGFITWTWNQITLFRFKHTIKVTAYDSNINRNFNSSEVTVWKFL